MNEDDFDEPGRVVSADAAGERHAPHPALGHNAPLRGRISDARAGVTMPGKTAARPDVVWVRASDLLNTGAGRIAGRGIDFEAELARRMRRTPTTTRRAMRERADRLPPLSEFGPLTEHPQVPRFGFGRR